MYLCCLAKSIQLGLIRRYRSRVCSLFHVIRDVMLTLPVWQSEMFGLIGSISWLAMSCFKKLPGPWFNLKMSSYQCRKSHCGDKTVVRSSYLNNGISYTGKMTSLYWIRAQDIIEHGYYLQCGRFVLSSYKGRGIITMKKIFFTFWYVWVWLNKSRLSNYPRIVEFLRHQEFEIEHTWMPVFSKPRKSRPQSYHYVLQVIHYMHFMSIAITLPWRILLCICMLLVMACCLVRPSYYLKQYSLLISQA